MTTCQGQAEVTHTRTRQESSPTQAVCAAKMINSLNKPFYWKLRDTHRRIMQGKPARVHNRIHLFFARKNKTIMTVVFILKKKPHSMHAWLKNNNTNDSTLLSIECSFYVALLIQIQYKAVTDRIRPSMCENIKTASNMYNIVCIS